MLRLKHICGLQSIRSGHRGPCYNYMRVVSYTYIYTQKENVVAPPGNPRVLTVVGFASPANSELIDDRSMKLFFLWIFSIGEGDMLLLQLKIVSKEFLLEVAPLLLLLIAVGGFTL